MGKLVLFLLISAYSFAQVNTMTIQGNDYTFVGDSFREWRTPRTGATPEERYPEVVWNDLDTYLSAFVKDAILANQDLDLAFPNQPSSSLVRNPWIADHPAAFDPIMDVTRLLEFGDRPGSVAASSFNSTDVGYRIIVDRELWNGFYYRGGEYINAYQSAFEQRLRLMHHEFGHALLHHDHRCIYSSQRIQEDPNWGHIYSSYPAIMATGACGSLGPPAWGQSRSVLSNFEVAVRHFFRYYNILPRSSRTAKGRYRDVIDN